MTLSIQTSSPAVYSRFFFTDLQVHTPADPQQAYGDWGGKLPSVAFAKKFIEICRERRLQVFAVTDHNRVDWYPALREEGDRQGVYVFPGVEVSVNRCHIVVVWDRDDEGYRLAQQFLASCWDPGADRFASNGDPVPVGRGQVADVAERALLHKGLVLAPHCTQKDIGFFAKGVCTNRAEVIKKNLIAGFDVYGNVAQDVLKNPNSEFTQLPVAWFISGDVRSFDSVGVRASYLKLGAEPTLEGLRQAFLMPETRIRLPETLRATWGHVVGVKFFQDPRPMWPRVTRVHVTGGFHDGLDFEMAPGLNAIIGGKGTGKSAMLEIIRYATEARAPSEKDLLDNRKQNFRANAEARVTFVDNQGQTYVATRVGNDTAARLQSGGLDTGVAVSRRFKITVFGQRELRQLADGQSILRQFVASTSGEEWEKAETEEKQIRQALHDANVRLDQLETTLGRLEDKEGDLADLKEKLDQARRGGAEELLERGRTLTALDVKVQAALRWPSEVEATRAVLVAHLPPPDVPAEDGIPHVIANELTRLAAAIEAANADLGGHLSAASTALAPAAAEWKAHVTAASASITAALAALGITDAAELTRIQKTVAELESELSNLANEKTNHARLQGDRMKLLEKLDDVARRKSRIVEDAARTLNKRLAGRVRLVVEPLADKDEITEWLKKQMQGAGISGAQLQKLAAHPTMTIAKAFSGGAASLTALGCSATMSVKLLERLTSKLLREFEGLTSPDRIFAEVNLGVGGAEVWKPVGSVSPGQRATALLALVLLSSGEPLIIDQPEDDLDNQHIYEDIVRVLAEVCQTRQVIVATHNANIPVLGDAELVVVLNADADRSRMEAIGGFEDNNVASYARRVLEGGEDAFHARQRRYTSHAAS
jgi:DNA repair exonuclease SbcCD ATPase subunit